MSSKSQIKDFTSGKQIKITDYDINGNTSIPEASMDGFGHSTPNKPNTGGPSSINRPNKDVTKNMSGSGEHFYDNDTFGGGGFQPSSHKKSSQKNNSRSPSNYGQPNDFHRSQGEQKKPDLYLPDDDFEKAYARNNPKKVTPKSRKVAHNNLGSYPGLDDVNSLENSSLLNPSMISNNLDRKVPASPKGGFNNLRNSSGLKLDNNSSWQSPSQNKAGGGGLSKSL